ncbi:hypothetical protein D3C76_989450 [compost metagenome]
MAGDHGGAEAADQQGDHREDARLGEHRDADGQANAHQALDDRPLRALKTYQHPAALVGRGPAGPGGHAQGHEPHDDTAGPAAANAAQGGQAEVPVDQDVVQRDVQQQAQAANDHARAGAAQAVAVAAQHIVEGNAGEAEGNTLQVAHARLDQLRIDLHHLQDRFGADQQATGDQTDRDCQPQGLAHQWPDFAVLTGAKALRHLGGGGQQDAGHQQEHRNPDRVAQSHRRQVARADPAGHDRIDEAHGGGGQLGDDDRCGQQQQAAQFGAYARGAGQGRGKGVAGLRCHKTGVQKGAQSRLVYALTHWSGNLSGAFVCGWISAPAWAYTAHPR